MKKVLLILSFIFLAISCSDSNSGNNSNNNQLPDIDFTGKTTILFYIDGTSYEQPEEANSFFKEVATDNVSDALGYTPANYMIKKMIENINMNNTNIIVQTASSESNMKWTDEQITLAGADVSKYYIKDWDKIQRWQIKKGEISLLEDNIGTVCKEGSTVSPCVEMNSSTMVSDFLNYGIENYKADRYIVIFFSHGGGSVGGFGYPNAITAVNMKQAFEAVKVKNNVEFDIIGFAACLMGNVEWMYNLADYGKYYVGSEEVEYYFPWILGDVTTSIGNGDSSVNVAKKIADSYYRYSAQNGEVPTNISVVNLKKIKNINDNLNKLSQSILNNFDTNPTNTINNFFVSLYRTQRYADQNNGVYTNGLYDLYNFLENLDEKLWYNQDYSTEINNLKELIKDNFSDPAVIYNKTSPYLSDSNGISFHAVDYAAVQTLPEYDTVTGDFGSTYINMLSTLNNKLNSIQANNTITNITTSGSVMTASIDTNVAINHFFTLNAKKVVDGKMRAGTVAGEYSLTASASNNPDSLIYTVSVDTGYENKNDVNLFAINKTNTTDYNPIYVNFVSGLDRKGADLIGITRLLVTRNGVQHKIFVFILYEPVSMQVKGLSAVESIQSSLFLVEFNFEKGDIVSIPEYQTSVNSKLAQTQLPAYEFTCDGPDCVDFSVQNFISDEPLQFFFNLQNIQGKSIEIGE